MRETSAQKRHRHYGRTCFGTECVQTPLVAPNGDKRCRCQEGLYNGLRGECIYCFGHPFADWEWELLTGETGTENAGFVETDSDNFPLILIGHRGDKRITVKHVRADSITVRECKVSGYVDILFEVYASDITGTIPMVDYYTTEAQG